MTHSDVFSKLRSDLPNRQSTSPRIVITDSYAGRDNTTGSYNNYATTAQVELLQQTLKEKDRLIRHMDKIINLLITNNNAAKNLTEGARKDK